MALIEMLLLVLFIDIIIFILGYLLYLVIIIMFKIIYPWSKLRISKRKTRTGDKYYQIQKSILFDLFYIDASRYINDNLFFNNKEEAKQFIRNHRMLK